MVPYFVPGTLKRGARRGKNICGEDQVYRSVASGLQYLLGLTILKYRICLFVCLFMVTGNQEMVTMNLVDMFYLKGYG